MTAGEGAEPLIEGGSGRPGPDADPERLAEENRRLRAEVDALRLENQRLRVEALRLKRPASLLARAGRILYREARGGVKRLRRRLVPPAASAERAAGETAFQPYNIRPLHPPAQGRPRILHAVGNFHTGGSSRLVVDLIERLGHRFEQEVLTRDNPSRPGYVGLQLHHQPQLRSTREAVARLRDLRPDLLHVHYLGHHGNRYSARDWEWYSHLFQAAEAYGCKVIENVNIPVPPYVSDGVGCYIYVSDSVRARFARPDARNVTIYPGSDLSRFARSGARPPPDDCAGMVYRLEADKLDERAIDVFLEVIRRRPGTRALIVGGGRFLETYRAAARRAGVADAFTFTGYAAYEDLPRLYERMSVFVAPVHTESFGHVAALAMGMEIPVVGYRVGALPEIVGDVELLAPPGDSAGLAGIIAGLLEDRERRMRIGADNRQRAQRLFSVEAMVAGYAALYDELLRAD